MSDCADHSEPAQGDILLFTADAGDANSAYSIGIAPGPPLVSFRGYEQAVSAAEALAAERNTTAWLTDGKTFRPLTRSPAPEEPQSGTAPPTRRAS